jgi:hypothetical protein
MSSANFRGMRTRRGFIRECGRATRWALLPGLVALIFAMGLVVAAPPVVAGTQSQNFTIEMGSPQLGPIEVLSAFTLSTTGPSSTSGKGSSTTALATMPVNDESLGTLLADTSTGEIIAGLQVRFGKLLSNGNLEPDFTYLLHNVQITNYWFQDEPVTGASVQVTFRCQSVKVDIEASTS